MPRLFIPDDMDSRIGCRNTSDDRGADLKKAYPSLRNLMRRKKVRQGDIADYIGRSRRHVVNCMNGSSCFSETELYKIADLLGIDNIGRYFSESERNGICSSISERKVYRLRNYELVDALVYKGMGVNDIAEMSCLSATTVRKMLRGGTVNISVAEVFADYLNMTVGELFHEKRYFDAKVQDA